MCRMVFMQTYIYLFFFLILILGGAGKFVYAGYDEAIIAYEDGDFSEAIEIWKKRTTHDDAIAHFNLGLIYEKGLGVQKDLNRAELLYYKAAKLGLAEAQINLAIILSKKNVSESLKWLLAASNNSNNDIKYNALRGIESISKNLSPIEIRSIKKQSKTGSFLSERLSNESKIYSFRLVTLSTKQIKKLQQKLKNLGFKLGPVDGIVGPETRGALKIWRERSGLVGDVELVPQKIFH